MASVVEVARPTYGNMIGALGVRGNGDGDADDAKEHEDEGPPGEVGEAAVDGGEDGADKGDDPGEQADGDGGQGKGVADDAAETEGGTLAVVVAVFHCG